MSPRLKDLEDEWAGLGAVDPEEDEWAGLGAIEVKTREDFPGGVAEAVEQPEARPNKVNELPTINIEGDPAPDEPWYQTLIRGVNEGSEDIMRGFAQGITWRAGDEISALGNQDRLQQFRADNARSQERSPWLYAGGEAFGTLAPGLITGPISAGVSGLGSRMLTGAGQGAAQGALTGAASGGEGDTAEDMAWRALAGGTVGALTGGAVPAVAAGLGKARDVAGDLATRARASAIGASGNAYRNVAQAHGQDFASDELAQFAERELPHNVPWSARNYAEAAGPLAQRTGQAVGDAVDQASYEVPQAIVSDDLVQGMNQVRGGYASQLNDVDRGKALIARRLIGRTEQRFPPGQQLSPRDLHSMKTDLESVGYPDKATLATPAGMKQTVSRDMSAVPREALHNAILGTGGQNLGGGASPQTQAQFSNAFSDHARAATLRDIAQRRAIDQGAGSQSVLSPRGMLSAIGGDYLPDATAMGLRGVESGARVGNQVIGAAAQSPQSISGQTAGRLAGSFMDGGQGQQRDRIQGEARGDILEPVITKAVNAQPGLFGPYLPGFITAAQSGDPHAIASLLDRLKSDERWRTQFLPRFQQMTAPGGGF